jgi:hypothetical protein
MNPRNDAQTAEDIQEWDISKIALLKQQHENSFAQFLMHLDDGRKVRHNVSNIPNFDQPCQQDLVTLM